MREDFKDLTKLSESTINDMDNFKSLLPVHLVQDYVDIINKVYNDVKSSTEYLNDDGYEFGGTTWDDSLFD